MLNSKKIKKKCLFLGYTSKKTKIISNIRNLNWDVKEYGQKKINLKELKKYNLLISFGYNKVINKNIISNFKKPMINLHISYLPYNRGAYPNYWSFVDGTPSGVSIHEISKEIDKGDIIFQKKIHYKNMKNLTFKNSYEILIKELEFLFIKNIKKILRGNYSKKKQILMGTYHKKKDLPKNFNWNINILNYLKKV